MGRQHQLITPENDGGDETSSPSPPKFTFFDASDVPCRPNPRGLSEQPRGLFPDPPDQPGFPAGLPPALALAGCERAT